MKLKLTKNWWFWPFVVGILLRLIVMPITFHPDFLAQTITSYFFSHKGIINIYDYLISLPAGNSLAQNFSIQYIYIYPPLMYFSQGILNLLVRPFTDSSFIPWVIENVSNIYIKDTLSYHLFIYKLPYLIIDLIAGVLLSNIFSELKKKKIAFLLWMLNPLAIYTTFIVGQNDLLPVVFTILSLLYFERRNTSIGMIMLGIAGSLKMYALLFILPAAFLMNKNLLGRLKLIVIGFLPYVLTVGPFAFSKGFRQLVLLNPESQKVLFMRLPLSGAEGVLVFMMFLVFIYIFSYYETEKISPNNYFGSIMLLLFSTTHFHPQWFLWATPFLVIFLTKNNYSYSMVVLLLIAAWAGITFLFEPSLNYALFASLKPEIANGVAVSSIVSKYYDANLLKSVIRSIFAGASLYLMIIFMRRKLTKY